MVGEEKGGEERKKKRGTEVRKEGHPQLFFSSSLLRILCFFSHLTGLERGHAIRPYVPHSLMGREGA